MYRNPPELTPSPQPLSPSSAYTHNTPSPFNMANTAAAGIQGNYPLISPNQQYNATNEGGRNNVSQNAPPPMDVSNYNAFSQQQQYHANNYGGAGATHWEVKLNPVSAAAINNLSNLHNTNTFTMHNLLTHTNAAGGLGNGTGTGWNLTSNHLHQQQYQQLQRANDGLTNNNNESLVNAVLTPTSVNTSNNANSNEHGLSNLLTFDSEQLVRINSEDQQMLRLNSEDLQISNLSIST